MYAKLARVGIKVVHHPEMIPVVVTVAAVVGAGVGVVYGCKKLAEVAEKNRRPVPRLIPVTEQKMLGLG